ncbi:MAG: Gfo/Idh/MocA family oxidoreductase [Cyclobacteriaceae bacterium]|nr:Gfo/Idh/MocA family oxidoreductase [Cyclobacteriaceae bacterium]
MKKIQNNTSRRKFLKTTSKLAVFTLVPRMVLGGRGYVPPSDQITIGFIGTGKQSRGLSGGYIPLENVRIIANADVDQQKREAYAQWINEKYAERTGKPGYSGMDIYGDYHELIGREDIDAVIVATPDHWHARIAIDAMNEGKDVYCEKPMAHTVFEGRKMVEATRKKKRVFQTGSMQRSWKDFRRACELVRNGYAGDIRTIKVNVGDPAIRCDLPGEDQPAHLDWNMWLGPAQERPYNSILSPPISYDGWPNWRKYWEYGGGGVTDWGAHMFDIAQWGLGMDESGPVELIPPATAGAVRGLRYIYSNGVEMVHEDFGRGYAVEFIGTKGTIRISREFLEAEPENILSAEIPSGGIQLYKSDNHYKNWIDCILSREMPVCDVETGHRTATVCNIGNIAYKMNKPLKWDPVKEIFDNKEANSWLTKKYRKPYKV